MRLTTQEVRLGNGSPDDDGRLVFAENRLVAVLVRLGDLHGEEAGHWFLETGYGRTARLNHKVFPDLNAALAGVAAASLVPLP